MGDDNLTLAFVATVSQVLALHAPCGDGYGVCAAQVEYLESGPCETVQRLERYTPPDVYRQALARLKTGGE